MHYCCVPLVASGEVCSARFHKSEPSLFLRRNKDHLPARPRSWYISCLHHQPSKDSDRFAELVTFMSHVAPCYKKETKEFGPQLKALLEQHGPVLVGKRYYFL